MRRLDKVRFLAAALAAWAVAGAAHAREDEQLSPYRFMDLTPAVLTPGKDVERLKELALEGVIEAVVVEDEIRGLEVAVHVTDPRGLLPPRVVTADWLKSLRTGGRFVVQVDMSDFCRGPLMVGWAVSVNGVAISDAKQVRHVWVDVARPDVCPQEPPKLGGPFVVNTPKDESDAKPGDGYCAIASNRRLCSLRAAVEEANAWPGPDEITFMPTVNPQMSRVSGLTVTEAVLITGLGQSQTKITAAALTGPLFVVPAAKPGAPAVSLTVRRLGLAFSDVHGAQFRTSNALMENQGRVDLVALDVSGFADDAMLHSSGDLTVRSVALSAWVGAGPWNTALMDLRGRGRTHIVDSGFSDVQASSVLQLAGDHQVFVENSTFEGRLPYSYAKVATPTGIAGFIGVGLQGLPVGQPLVTLRHVTISQVANDAQWGLFAPGLSGRIRMGHTLLAHSDGGCAGQSVWRPNPATSPPEYVQQPIAIESLGWNVVADAGLCRIAAVGGGAAPGDQLGTTAAPIDPMLEPKGIVSGQAVIPLKPGSPARDAGNSAPFDPADPATCLAKDQVGGARPQGGGCDAGAFEQ